MATIGVGRSLSYPLSTYRPRLQTTLQLGALVKPCSQLCLSCNFRGTYWHVPAHFRNSVFVSEAHSNFIIETNNNRSIIQKKIKNEAVCGWRPENKRAQQQMCARAWMGAWFRVGASQFELFLNLDSDRSLPRVPFIMRLCWGAFDSAFFALSPGESPL